MVGDKLERYRSKRDFARTPEPPPGGKGAASGFFIVQKHDATRLHYDFRLAHGGALWSSAVTNVTGNDPKDERMACRTEGQPLDYAVIERSISTVAQGVGAVM